MTSKVRLTVTTFGDAVAAMPLPGSLALGPGSEWDLYVGAIGFEERCLSVVTAAAAAGSRLGQAFLAEYDTNRDDNMSNYPALAGGLAECGATTRVSGPGMEIFAKELRELLLDLVAASTAVPRVLLDVSGGSNRFVMTCARALLEHDVDLTVAYAEANMYFPTREDWDLNAPVNADPALEAGVGELSVTVDLPGYHVENLPDTVAVIAGFGRDRARASIARVDQSLLSIPGDAVHWMLGLPHLPQDEWRVAAQEIANAVPEGAPRERVSTFDYRETALSLERLHAREAGRRQMTLAPLGSKMQALGAALFCWARPEVRVVFASPVAYRATRYSEGTKALWSVPIGSTAALRDTLESVDQVRLYPAA